MKILNSCKFGYKLKRKLEFLNSCANMRSPKFYRPHIVGDDTSSDSDESPPFSPTSAPHLDADVDDGDQSDSFSDDSSSTGSTDSLSSVSSSTSPVRSPIRDEDYMPNSVPPGEDNVTITIAVSNATTQTQDIGLNATTQTQKTVLNATTQTQDTGLNATTQTQDTAPMAAMANVSPIIIKRELRTEDCFHVQSKTENSEADPHMLMLANAQTGDMPSTSLTSRRTAPARLENLESIGARVAKRARRMTVSGESFELAKPFDVTNYFQEVSARLVRERVALQPFQEYCQISNRALEKAIARSKQGTK